MSRRLLVSVGALVVFVGFLYFVRTDRVRVPEPVIAPGPSLAPISSSIALQLEIPIKRVAELANAKLPKRTVGRAEDPTDWLSEDNLDYYVNLGTIEVAPVNGRLAISVPFSGSATVKGKLGVRQRNKGILGWIESVFNVNFRETVVVSGTVNADVLPRLRSDWTLDPSLQVSVTLAQAEARLFSKGGLKLSLRGKIGEDLREDIDERLREINATLAADGTIRTQADRAWRALHLVSSLSEAPSVWLALTPQELAARDAIVSDSAIAFIAEAVLSTSVSVGAKPPVTPPSSLGALEVAASDSGSAKFAIPVLVPFEKFRGVTPESLGLEPNFATPVGPVTIQRISLQGDNDTLYVGVSILAKPNWFRRIEGTLWLAGKPVLNAERTKLSVEGLQYAVETKDALVKTADWLLAPTILSELKKRAVFDLEPIREELLARAGGMLAQSKGRLPPGVTLDASVRSLDFAKVTVDDGWLIFVLRADGPLRMRLDSLPQLGKKQ